MTLQTLVTAVSMSISAMFNIKHNIFLLSDIWSCFIPSEDSSRITCRRTLRHRNGNFPLTISTEFIPACASYFLSSSTCFLHCHSHCSSITIVPILWSAIRHCGDNNQSVSSHIRISLVEWNRLRNVTFRVNGRRAMTIKAVSPESS